MNEKSEQTKVSENILKHLNKYKEFWFFLSGLFLGYLLHAIA